MKLPNRILEDASNQPTAAQAYNLSGTAQTGFRTFASQLTNGDTTVVLAEEVDANGNPAGAWELAACTYTTGTPNTLASRTLIESSSGALIDWSMVGSTPRLGVVVSGQQTVSSILRIDVTGSPSTVEIGDFIPGHNYEICISDLYLSANALQVRLEFYDGAAWTTTATRGTSITKQHGSTTVYSDSGPTGAGVFDITNGSKNLVATLGGGLSSRILLLDPASAGTWTRGVIDAVYDLYSSGEHVWNQNAWRFDAAESHTKCRLIQNGSATFASGHIVVADLGEGVA